MNNSWLFVILTLSMADAWQFRLRDFDFQVENIFSSPEFGISVFESAYLNSDFFSLLSTSKSDHVDADARSILIGARNYLYNLTLPNLELINKQSWPVSDEDRIKCINDTFITNKDECDNYIKLFVKIEANTNSYQLCSTNAYNPKCTKFTIDMKQQILTNVNETSVLGYFPVKNDISYLYNFVNNKLYTVYSIDYLNSYYSSTINQDFFQISTHIDDRNWLNKADFVSTFSYDEDYMYFVFNENQLYETSIDTVKSRRISSISRVCLNDNGASFNYNNLNNIWTTFLKTKLNCVYKPKYTSARSYFNNRAFHFDEITSMSDLFKTESINSNAYFYATFSTSEYDMTASAVCVFHMNEIMGSFNGDYSAKRGSAAANLEIPNPRPSSCPSNLTYEHLLFTRKNVAMKTEIYADAFIIESGLENKFVKIDVDYHVSNAYDSLFDVLFVATDNGLIMKFVIPIDKSSNKIPSFEINRFYKEKYTLQEGSVKSIDNLRLYKDKSRPVEKSLIVTVNANKIVSISKPVIHNCDLKTNKSACDNHVNPYCFWIARLSKCLFYDGDNSELIQLIDADNRNETDMNTTLAVSQSADSLMSTSTRSVQSNESNPVLISFLFIIAIFVSFILGMFITLKLLKQEVNLRNVLNKEQRRNIVSSLRSRFNTVKGSATKYIQSIKINIRAPEHLRTFISRFKKPAIATDTCKQHEACCSSSNTSENSDPRYVYVLNLMDYSGKMETTQNTNPYSINCIDQATPSIRTIVTSESNDFYMN